MYNKIKAAEEKGYNDAIYGYTYINPYWSEEEMRAWERGFKKALKDWEVEYKTKIQLSNENRRLLRVL